MKLAQTVQLLFQEITRFMDMHKEESSLMKRVPEKIENMPEIEQIIDRDIHRLRFCVRSSDGEEEASEIDKNSKPVMYLRKIAAKLYSIEEYYQEILDFLIPIIYTEVAADKDVEYSKVEKDCMAIYESFLYEYLKNQYALALRYETTLQKMEGYYIVKEIDFEQIKGTFIELSHTALWFSRTFAYEDLVYIYAYLLRSELHAPYVFFLASIRIIREREEVKPMFDLKKRSAILGEKKMKGLIVKSKELDKKIGHFFKDGLLTNKTTAFMVLAGVGIVAAVAAGLCMSRHKSTKE
ncbi:uncharacterized protein NESG_00904 [Nematocida ausubeli]|uniref:Rab-GAP TBC domain-containing protein n=1 Tax=Nematocida ausubeli (strain ATCC PRA-371 / ERTm2) TaxID=1913371 RepID=A0A086J3N2_NEMA1|nr:uncharacterized protein NESG_00904 [Nematocida ausubeli]KFG26750.1 hypothetical protein NESG_00904 [Nematocida ausubeli]